jgi:hypothetical protein
MRVTSPRMMGVRTGLLESVFHEVVPNGTATLLIARFKLMLLDVVSPVGIGEMKRSARAPRRTGMK